MAKQRLDKVLADMGLGTRKEVRDLIRAGRVMLGYEVVRDPGQRVDPLAANIRVGGEALNYTPQRVYMLNKPPGLITATRDNKSPTVLDLFPPALRNRIFPVGRLDKDTEGLLLLTDDGQLAHRLMSPRKQIEKEYEAHIDAPVDERLIAEFAAGVDIGDPEPALPATLKILKPTHVRVTVTEGRYHLIKRLFAAHGLTVLYLKRLRIANLWLDPWLPLGAYRPLSSEELNRLAPG